MNDTSAFLARVLNQGKVALAGYAASELWESHPAALGGVASDSLSACQSWFAARLRELAAAASAADSGIFARQLQWSQRLLAARGVSIEQLEASLGCLRNVLARELPESVRPLALEYLDRGLDAVRSGASDASERLTLDTPESRLTADYLLATLEGDRRTASRMIFDAVEQGRSMEDVVNGVLLPAQVEIGRMWHANEINVAEEHFTSETTKKIMAQLMSRAEFKPSNGKTFVAAGVAGNHIDIGLQAVADSFELDGWRSVQLGANVPAADIVQAVEFFDGDLLGLSASQSTQLETVRDTINAVHLSSRGEDVKIIVGGFAFAACEHLPPQLGADGYAPNAPAAVELGRQLVLCSPLRQGD